MFGEKTYDFSTSKMFPEHSETSAQGEASW